jgi:integrase
LAHIQKRVRPGRQTIYYVRYHDPAGRERARAFKRKSEAERWLSSNEVAKLEGNWVDPQHLRVPLAHWAEHYMATGLWKPKTRNDYESLLRSRVLPSLGPLPLGRLDQVIIKSWVAEMHNEGLSAYRIRNAYRLLSKMLKAAVEAGFLPKNPALGVALPRIAETDMTILSAQQVASFVRAMPKERGYDVLIEILAFGGLRWGEIAAVRRSHCELLRGRLQVTESVADVNGHLIFQPTKTYERRYVPLPGKVVEHLGRHLETVPNERDSLVFTTRRGTPLRNQNFRRSYFGPASLRAGLPPGLTPHGLRHTCASLLIDQGADPVAVQRHLGHRDVSTTLRIYRHLFEHRTDELVGALDALYEAAEIDAGATATVAQITSGRRRTGYPRRRSP